VRTTDILPTILDLVGATIPEGLDGESLKTYLTNSPSRGTLALARTAFGETDYPLRFGWAPLRSVRAEGFKFIEAPRPEFYDLYADAAEMTNQYEPWNAQVQRFRGMLAELRANQNTQTPPREPSRGVVGQQTINELKALGYLGPADVGSTTSVPEPSMLPDPKDKIEEQNLLHRAMMASEDNRNGDARAALERVLQLDPKSPTALRQLGELELHAGDYAKAAQHLKGAIEQRPDDATALFYEGQALEKTGEFPAARDALEASLKLVPGQLSARLLVGHVYLELKEPKAAEDQFEAALLLRTDSVDAQLGLANAQIDENNFAEAAKLLQQLSTTHSRDAEVFEALAEAYAGMGKTAEAHRAKSRARLLGGQQK
jgi:choline-sulfatase